MSWMSFLRPLGIGLAGLFSALHGSLLLGQSEEVEGLSGETFELSALTVEGSRFMLDGEATPMATAKLDATLIQRTNLQLTLAESLGHVPGVFVLNAENYAQDTRLAIRGFGARSGFGIRGIRLFLDGLPLTTPDGQGEVDSIDLGSVKQMEVLRGSASVLYGAAAGGVLHMESEEGQGPGFVESRFMAGQSGLQQVQVKQGEGEGKVRSLLSLAHVERSGFRGHSGTRNFRLNGNVVYQVSEHHRLKFVFNYIDYPLQNDPGGLTLAEALDDPRQARARNVLYDAGESVRQERIGVIYDLKVSTNARADVTLFHTQRQFGNRLPFESGGQVGYQRAFQGGALRLHGEGDWFRIQTGLEVNEQVDDRLNFDNVFGQRGEVALDQEEKVTAMGLFAFADIWPTGPLTVHLGSRYDRVGFSVKDTLLRDGDDSGSLDFSAHSPFVGVQWVLNRDWRLYMNRSASFETPTTTEFSNPSGGGFNAGLKPQTATSWEVGFRYSFKSPLGDGQLALSAFRIREVDALVPYSLEDYPGRDFFRNAGQTERRGIELNGAIEITRHWDLRFDVTLSDFKYTSFVVDGNSLQNKRLPGIPRLFGGLALDYDGQNGLFLGLSTHLVGSLFADDANTVATDATVLTDFRIGQSFLFRNHLVEPFLSVANVFDQRHFGNIRINAAFGRYYEPGHGRLVFVGVRVRFSSDSPN